MKNQTTTHCPRCDSTLNRRTLYLDGGFSVARRKCVSDQCNYYSDVVLQVGSKTGVASDGELNDLRRILGTTSYSRGK